MPTSTQLKDLLPEGTRILLRTAYDRQVMLSILKDTLPRVYAPAEPYVSAIVDAFFGDVPDEEDQPRDMLSVKDRERCLIAVLAARGAGFTLAIHIYLALMEDVSLEEIAHILLLAGAYAGIDMFTGGLEVARHTVTALVKAVGPGGAPDAPAVLALLRKEFDS